ncbi:hypothetical protein HNR22_001803 [Micromonospora jinlongensis]|uniref:FXSXX-COOH protein n=1 Tax=Micromonospora jinlongensis TaxID=1287877 RepID=A0A7Y9WYT1_9ACTN|nr:hypothetical protein [Micromonospora jinlongensis]NYH42076.1 hypothetical protein [Micromonospora jinlongensis]
MSDRTSDTPAETSATSPEPTVEFHTEPELTEAVARALLTLLQRSSASSNPGPVESTDA